MIPIIKFKKEYYNKIITGKKTQTLRMARKKLDVHEDETCKAIFPGTTKEALIHINKIGYKQFKSVDQEDAEREGYNTLRELREDLKKIYPLLEAFDRLYYYRFEFISEVEPWNPLKKKYPGISAHAGINTAVQTKKKYKE